MFEIEATLFERNIFLEHYTYNFNFMAIFWSSYLYGFSAKTGDSTEQLSSLIFSNTYLLEI